VSDDPVGIEIPDEHVGPFVAEVFEDAERDTDWTTVVEELVAPSARAAWDDLSASEQVAEVLAAAADYDENAVETLAAIPTDGSMDPGAIEERFGEARRCRRNADTFRDGVATAYADGHVDEDGLVAAIESVGFDTDTIAERESELERVANHYDLDFQPYGGTLIEDDDRIGEEQTAPETW